MNLPKTKKSPAGSKSLSWDCAKMNLPKTEKYAVGTHQLSWDCAKMNLPKTPVACHEALLESWDCAKSINFTHSLSVRSNCLLWNAIRIRLFLTFHFLTRILISLF